jgi:toxin ParE1/3/4
LAEKRYELSERAARDLNAILRESGRRFGPVQQESYARLMLRALEMAAGEPQEPESRQHDEIVPGLRSLRVDRAAPRHGASSHVIFYRRTTLKDGEHGVRVVRILHHYMDPARHLTGRSG